MNRLQFAYDFILWTAFVAFALAVLSCALYARSDPRQAQLNRITIAAQ